MGWKTHDLFDSMVFGVSFAKILFKMDHSMDTCSFYKTQFIRHIFLL